MSDECRKGNPFEFPSLNVKGKGRPKSLKSVRGPKVIIAGSGMMNGGRIVTHAKDFLEDKNTRLFFIGYQGIGTLGKEIKDGSRDVVIDKKRIHINATVTAAEGMSSHAGQGALLEWLKRIKGTRKLILTHGEVSSRDAYEQLVKRTVGISDIVKPLINEEHLI